MTKMLLKYYARWMGYMESVTHDRNGIYPYVFRKGEWIEIVKADSEWYQKKADRNLGWEYMEKKVLKTIPVHMARFMGVVGKKQINYELVDRNPSTDEAIKGTMRKYAFKAELWIEIHEKDVARFQRKANANVSWEFETEYVPMDTKPERLGGIVLEDKEEEPSKADKKAEEKAKKKAEKEAKKAAKRAEKEAESEKSEEDPEEEEDPSEEEEIDDLEEEEELEPETDSEEEEVTE